MSSDDPLREIREHEEAVRKLGKRDGRGGALARYLLDLAHGELPDDRDADTAGLPQVDGQGNGPSHEVRGASSQPQGDIDPYRGDTQFCPHCGEDVANEDQYCRFCGGGLER